MKTGALIATVIGLSTLGFTGVYIYKKHKAKGDEETDSPENQNVISIVKPKYKIGEKLYADEAEPIKVNKAEKINNKWAGTNDEYGTFSKGKKVGIIEHAGIVPDGDKLAGQPYYIVRDCTIESFSVFGIGTPTAFCKYGVVIETQVTNKN